MSKSFHTFIKDEEAKKKKHNLIQSEEKKMEKALSKEFVIAEEEIKDIVLDKDTYLKYVINGDR